VGDGLRRPDSPEARGGDDERHAERRIVGEKTVGPLAVVAEAFAVVGCQDDDGPPGRPFFVEGPEQTSQGEVGVGDLAVVRVGFIS
jgi:hypothetical protein